MGIGSKIKLVWTAGTGVTKGLTEFSDAADPFKLFETWFQAASDAGILLPEAMTLATASRDGKPSSRMVLLKGHGRDGFVFFTNYGSRKSKELDANPWAALQFHWAVLQRQIRIEGRVERIGRAESERYFKSRPRDSQLGAWASQQSDKLENRDQLTDRFKRMKSQFEGKDIPLPDFWGGYIVIPDTIEFWQGRASRLHDRLRFERQDTTWTSCRLFP